jgi:hypothetical protein
MLNATVLCRFCMLLRSYLYCLFYSKEEGADFVSLAVGQVDLP